MIVCLNGNILLAPSGPRQDDEEACLHISKCLLPFQVIFLEFVIFLQDLIEFNSWSRTPCIFYAAIWSL